MPFEYDILSDGRFLHIQYSGTVTPRDALRLLDALESDDRLRPHFVELSDHSTVSAIEIPDGDMQQMTHLIAGIYRRSAPPSQIAFVLPPEGQAERVVAYVSWLRDAWPGIDAHVFDRRADALALYRRQGLLPFELDG